MVCRFQCFSYLNSAARRDSFFWEGWQGKLLRYQIKSLSRLGIRLGHYPGTPKSSSLLRNGTVGIRASSRKNFWMPGAYVVGKKFYGMGGNVRELHALPTRR